jgi:hypothetical protein
MKIKITVSTNQQKLERFMEVVPNELQAEISKALWVGGKNTVKTVIDQSREPKSGVVGFYYKNGRKMGVVRSAPNETSAQQSGAKNRATKFNVNQNTLQVGIEKNIEYGKYIELGTKNMKARGDLQVALNKNKDLILDDVKIRLKALFDNMFK